MDSKRDGIKKNNKTRLFHDWTKFEVVFLVTGILVSILATFIFGGTIIDLVYTLTYFITAILLAKGKYACYIICFISTFFYAYVSYKNGYYGEIVISLGMTLPLSIYGFINWLKNLDKKKIVKIKDMTNKELVILVVSQILLFYPYFLMLEHFNTNNLIISTLSLVASVMATYCTARRSENGFIFYIMNDIILITLWGIPVLGGNSNIIPILICPVLLLINDVYGVYNWRKLKIEQRIKHGK